MTDPVIDEVRRVRKLISDEIGPDLGNLVEHYASYQRKFKRVPISVSDRRAENSVEVAERVDSSGVTTEGTR